MTTPVTIPAGQRTTGTGYTHRTWVDEMADALGLVAGIYKAFGVMDATLQFVEAGKTQLALVGECRVTALDVMTAGVRLVKDTDARYLPVFEAIAQAGGVDEVAKNKHYHRED